jgi:hypothetical protein
MRSRALIAALALTLSWTLSCEKSATSPAALPPAATPAAACRYSGGLTVTASVTIKTSCTVTGDLIVAGNAHLLIEYTASPNATFTVQGNIVTQDSSTLEARGSGTGAAFVVANQFVEQYSMRSAGRSIIRFAGIALQTRAATGATAGSLTMQFDAYDDAQMVLDSVRLDYQSSWLLGNFHNRARLQSYNSVHVPTETYLHDSSQVAIRGPKTETGVWFESPRTGVINLPLQTGPFSWQIGKSSGFATGWQLTIDSASVGLGLESLPGSQLTINGNGAPVGGELKIAYNLSGGQDTLRHLAVGVQNGTIGNGRLTFHNVNLGPIAWQLYVGGGEKLVVDSAVVIEIGFFGPASVSVDHSVLQFGVLGVLQPHDTLSVSNSEIWNQLIEANNDAVILFKNSRVVGSLLNAMAPASGIHISGGSFADNPAVCALTLTSILDVATGKPICNPYGPAGPPRRTGPGQVTCSGTTGCAFAPAALARRIRLP